MELLQLRYFKEVAECENISYVARRFMVPPSSVSVSVKKLENELRVQLFDRSSNTLAINEYGEILLRAVKRAESEIQRAITDILELSKTISGEICLLILTNRKYVMDKISRFKSEYPKVAFSIKHECYADCGNYSDYDIIISDGVINNNNFKREFFIHEEVCLALSTEHRFAGRECVNLQEIENEKIICMPRGSSLGDYVHNLFKKNNMHPCVAIECDEPECIREYTKIGLGVTFFPMLSWKSRIDKNVKLIRIGNGLYRDSYIYVNTDASDTIRIFSEELKKIHKT